MVRPTVTSHGSWRPTAVIDAGRSRLAVMLNGAAVVCRAIGHALLGVARAMRTGRAPARAQPAGHAVVPGR